MDAAATRSSDSAPRHVTPFTLTDLDGQQYHVPGDDPTVIVFLKEDCPTCDFAMRFIQRLGDCLPPAVRVLGVSQSDAATTAAFATRHRLTFPILLDTTLEASLDWGIESVPTLWLIDVDGTVLDRSAGFDRGEWDRLARVAAVSGDIPAPVLFRDGEEVPEWRPGCASRTSDAAFQRELLIRRGRDRLRSRRIEIGDLEDPFDFFFERGLTDGLPVVPPTEERVLRMLEGTRRTPSEVVAMVPPDYAPATVEKIAISAVMAGCKPEYLPVVLAAVEAACSDAFNMHGVLATTYFAAPLIIVNGPVRSRIGMNAGINVFGQGNRANATIGRALALVVRNIGGGRPGEIDRATLGQPGKYTYCVAENEEENPWEPLHVERGFRREDSTVTLFAAEAPRAMVDQVSRTARGVVTTLGKCMETVAHYKWYKYAEAVLVLCPEHVRTIARDGWTKADIRRRIQEVTAKPLRDLLADADDSSEGLPARVLGPTPPEMLEQKISKFAGEESIQIIVAGGSAGKFSAVIGGWVGGAMGSEMVTRKIEE
jgi:peroxiredoxin